MLFRRAQLNAWFDRKPDSIAVALALMSGLQSDIAAFRCAVAETRAAIAALREAWSRTPPSARSRRAVPSARIAATYRRASGHDKEVELT